MRCEVASVGRVVSVRDGSLAERHKIWAQPCPKPSLTPSRCLCSTASRLPWRSFGMLFPESSGRVKDLCTTQNEEASPHPPLVCFLSGGMEPSKTLNDRCYLICCCSCWKIVWKALSAAEELEFQPTPVADRSFQAGNILIISPSRKFSAKLSLQMIKNIRAVAVRAVALRDIVRWQMPKIKRRYSRAGMEPPSHRHTHPVLLLAQQQPGWVLAAATIIKIIKTCCVL